MTTDIPLDRAFEIAARQLPAAGIESVLIGGFAVNHYGYTRSALDVDFMIVINRLDLESDIRPLCERFGTPEAYRLIQTQIESLSAS